MHAPLLHKLFSIYPPIFESPSTNKRVLMNLECQSQKKKKKNQEKSVVVEELEAEKERL